MTRPEHVLAALALGIALSTVGSLCGPAAHADAGREARIFAALREVVAVGSPRRVPIAHCRHAGRPMPGAGVWARCERRLRAFAMYFEEAGVAEDVDPWTLAAIAVKEAGLNPFARGSVGESGLAQLHPRGIGARVPFVRSERVRRACRWDVGACQRDIVRIGAHHLAGWVHRCGSLEDGEVGYNSGHCGHGGGNYSRRVARIRARLVASVDERNHPGIPESSGDAQ